MLGAGLGVVAKCGAVTTMVEHWMYKVRLEFGGVAYPKTSVYSALNFLHTQLRAGLASIHYFILYSI